MAWQDYILPGIAGVSGALDEKDKKANSAATSAATGGSNSSGSSSSSGSVNSTTQGQMQAIIDALNKSKSTSVGQSNTSGVSSSSGTSNVRDVGVSNTNSKVNPLMDPNVIPMKDELIKQYTNLFQNDPDLKGYQANAQADINKTSDLRRQSIEGVMAAKGVSGPAAGSAIIGNENARFADSTKLNNSIPLLARDLHADALAKASAFLSSLPVGQESSSTTSHDSTQMGANTQNTQSQSQTNSTQDTQTEEQSRSVNNQTSASSTGQVSQGETNSNEAVKNFNNQNQTGNTVAEGNPLGGAFGNVAETLAYLQGSGKANPTKDLGSLAKTIGSVLGIGNGNSNPANVSDSNWDGVSMEGYDPSKIDTPNGTSGVLSKMQSFFKDPVTLAIGGGIAAIVALSKVGAGRKAADKFNEEIHNNYFAPDGRSGAINQIVNGFHTAADSGQLTREQGLQARNALKVSIDQYLNQAKEFASQGASQSKVISQDLTHLATLFGDSNLTGLLTDMDKKIAKLPSGGATL